MKKVATTKSRINKSVFGLAGQFVGAFQVVGQRTEYFFQFSRFFPRLNHIYVKNGKNIGMFGHSRRQGRTAFYIFYYFRKTFFKPYIGNLSGQEPQRSITAILASKRVANWREITTTSLCFTLLKNLRLPKFSSIEPDCLADFMSVMTNPWLEGRLWQHQR